MGFSYPRHLAEHRQDTALTEGLDFESFNNNEMVLDAVIRNLEIIGEAANHVPGKIQASAAGIPWKEMRTLRNLLAHEYFGADPKTIWEIVQNDLPSIVAPLEELLRNSRS